MKQNKQRKITTDQEWERQRKAHETIRRAQVTEQTRNARSSDGYWYLWSGTHR